MQSPNLCSALTNGETWLRKQNMNILFSSAPMTTFTDSKKFSSAKFLTMGSCTIYSVKYLVKMINQKKIEVVVKTKNIPFPLNILSCLILILDVMAKEGINRKNIDIIFYVDHKSTLFRPNNASHVNHKILQLYFFTFNDLYNIPIKFCYK